MKRVADEGLEQWLAQVRSEYWERLGEVSTQGDVPACSHVLFEVSGKRFAVDARACKGVVRRPRTTRLPGLPAYSMGVAGIRGEVVSVVDLERFLGLEEGRTHDPGFLLVLASEDLKAAMWVDRVADVLDLVEEEVLEMEAPWPGLPEGVILGQWGGEDDTVFVLDGKRLLRASAVGP